MSNEEVIRMEEMMLNEKTEKSSLGEKMAYCRYIVEFTLEALGKYLGVDEKQLHDYELDIVEPPLKFLLKFSKCFNIPIEDLIDDDLGLEIFSCKYDTDHFLRFQAVFMAKQKKNIC